MKNSVLLKYKKILPRLVVAGAVYFGIFGAGAYILTENLLAAVVFAVVSAPVFVLDYAKKHTEKVRVNSEKQFLEFMQLVLTSVSAGMAIEQAFSDTLENNPKSFKLIAKDIARLNRRTSMHFGFYDEFIDFAFKTGSKDIINLSQAVKIVGVKGGNLPVILRNSLAALRVKIETDNEIKQTLALPRYNHTIITFMPFGLVLMIKSISKGYIDVLYHTKKGFYVVIGVLAALLFAWILGNKICKIEIEGRLKDKKKTEKERKRLFALALPIAGGIFIVLFLCGVKLLSAFVTAVLITGGVVGFSEYSSYDGRKKMKRTMRFELSEITERIAILLEAGVPIWNAFVILAETAEDRRPLEKEIKDTVYSFVNESGYYYEPESALSNMADRVNDSTISTFVSLIVQNSRKGSGELVSLLRMQAVNQRTERRAIAKQLADEASTLMVIPSAIVLAAIMVLVAAPAIIELI